MLVEIPFRGGKLRGERWMLWVIDYLGLHLSDLNQLSFADIPDAIFYEDLSPDHNSNTLAAFGIMILAQSLSMRFNLEEFSLNEKFLVEFANQFDIFFRIEALRRKGLVVRSTVNDSTNTLGELIVFMHCLFSDDNSLSNFSIEAFDEANTFMVEMSKEMG